jgi:hypothetical protein
MISGFVTKICHLLQKKDWEEIWRGDFSFVHSSNPSQFVIVERCTVCGMKRARIANKEKNDGRKDC